VDFPCVYKFKVVGSGDNFVSSLTSDMEAVLGRRVPPSAFEFEPAGRYQRIIINVEVDSARQVTDLYEAVRTASGVKFSYG
jgi:putative lipoic acid-binding regulatory protein